MENIKTPIITTTAYLFIYTLLPFFTGFERFIGAFFFMSPFIVIWMVVNVLKNGKASDKKFDEGYWYEDAGKFSSSK